MIVDLGQQIRDASGDFACPNDSCWRMSLTRIRPTNSSCPKCGTVLEWSKSAREMYDYREARRNKQ